MSKLPESVIEDKIQDSLILALSNGKDEATFSVSRTNINLVQKHVTYMGYEFEETPLSDKQSMVSIRWKK